MSKILCCVLLLATGSSVLAEELLIRNATLHTGKAEPAQENMDILIRDGRIHRIGRELGTGGASIDAAGRIVTPGLFAGLTQLGLVEVSLETSTVDDELELGQMRPEFDVLPAYNPYSSLIPVTRIEGFTHTVIAPSSAGSIIAGQGYAIRLTGAYDSSVSAPVLFIRMGEEETELGGSNPHALGSRAGQFMQLRQAFHEAAGDHYEPANPHNLLTPLGRRALESFLDGDRRVVFQVDRAADIVNVLKLADEFDLSAVISGGAEAWKVADRLAAAKVPVLLNPLQNLPSSFDKLGSRLDNARLLHEAGVTIAFSGDESHNARKTRQLAGNAVSYGLPHEVGLAAIASSPGVIFGYQAGVIERGAPADLVIWSGDPLEVTTYAEQVIVAGESIEMRSRQTELLERYLK
ncbi:MAG: amidohydrolase [Xanthomonadales bacterium]|nr:amidohydrolase [Xanthomonadales bacterium]